MKQLKKALILIPLCMVLMTPASKAYTFNDPINTAINVLRNTLMQAKWVKEIGLAVDRLSELKAQTLETFRFHSGLDEIFDSTIGDSIRGLMDQGGSLKDFFFDAGFITPNIEVLGSGGTPQDIRNALESVTGAIPDTEARSYIMFEESQVVDAFHLAGQIRESGQKTRDAADLIQSQSKNASPKGAARLQVQGVSRLMVLEQQNQEVLAKMLELQATQIEQVTREEKRIEREKVKFLEDSSDFAEGLSTLYGGGAL